MPHLPAPPMRPATACGKPNSRPLSARTFVGRWLNGNCVDERNEAAGAPSTAPSPGGGTSSRQKSRCSDRVAPSLAFRPPGTNRVRAIHTHAVRYRFDTVYKPPLLQDMVAAAARQSVHAHCPEDDVKRVHTAESNHHGHVSCPAPPFHVSQKAPHNADLRFEALRTLSLGEHREPFIPRSWALVFRDSEGLQAASRNDALEQAAAASRRSPATPRSVAAFFDQDGDGGVAFGSQDTDFYRRLLRPTNNSRR